MRLIQQLGTAVWTSHMKLVVGARYALPSGTGQFRPNLQAILFLSYGRASRNHSPMGSLLPTVSRAGTFVLTALHGQNKIILCTPPFILLCPRKNTKRLQFRGSFIPASDHGSFHSPFAGRIHTSSRKGRLGNLAMDAANLRGSYRGGQNPAINLP